MEAPPTLEIVCQAINTLYHDPNTGEKEKASLWLGNLQRSVYAWKIADALLQQSFGLESCYFAAQTMRTKIQYAFHELPPDSYLSLRDSLLNHLSKVTEETASVIVTQLSLALADLILQMNQWNSPIPDVITRFGTNSATQNLQVLLEVLHVLPEEIGSRSLRLGEARRKEVTDSCKSVCVQVVQILKGCLVNSYGTKEEAKIQTRVFRCLGSWLSLGAIPPKDSDLEDIFKLVFFALVNQSSSGMLHEAATNCICNAVILIEDVEHYQELSHSLCHGVYSLIDSYHLAVAQEDPDKATNFCRIFTELAESLLDTMLLSPNQGLGNLNSLELLLNCVGHHDFEIAEITFNVWYRLSEGLYKENNENLNKVFQPYVQRLILALARHCEIEPDNESIPDETDDFGEFRQRATDLVRDIVYIVGSVNCFRQMFENLKNNGTSSSWNTSEASLFIMAAVAKNIIPEERDTVPQVIHMIFNLPVGTRLAFRYTSIRLLGELCEWIEKHSEYLDPVLNWLMTGLQEAALASISAIALQNICNTCRKQMTNHFDGLLQIIKAIDQFRIGNDAALKLIKGTANILIHIPEQSFTEALRQMCAAQTTPLLEIVKTAENCKDGAKPDPTIYLDRIAAIFRANPAGSVPNNQVQHCQIVVQEIWPVLSRTCECYQGDSRVVERCCRSIRFVVRSVSKHSLPLLEPLVTQMVSLYQVHHHSCFLYLGSILVDEYGSENGCVQGLIEMFQAFCGPTFQLLNRTNGLRDNPDVVDDLFRLCSRFLQRCPTPFLQAPTMEPLFQCALASSSIDHREVNSSVMKFLYDILRAGRQHHEHDRPHFQDSSTIVRQLIEKQGQVLVSTLIHSSVFSLSSYMLPDVADVIYELVQFDNQKMPIWLQEALRAFLNQNTGLTQKATPEQLAEFHTNVISAQQEKTVSLCLREFARLFR